MEIRLGQYSQRALQFGSTGNWFTEKDLNNMYEIKACVEV